MQKREEGMSKGPLEKERANRNGVRQWWRGCRLGGCQKGSKGHI